jgi:dipeptide/tripeptide permease
MEAKEIFPKVIYLILLNKLCEMMSFNGIKTVLLIFCKNFLGLKDNAATSIYHAVLVVGSFASILGTLFKFNNF